MFKTIVKALLYALQADAAIGVMFALLFVPLEFNVWTPKLKGRELVSAC